MLSKSVTTSDASMALEETDPGKNKTSCSKCKTAASVVEPQVSVTSASGSAASGSAASSDKRRREDLELSPEKSQRRVKPKKSRTASSKDSQESRVEEMQPGPMKNRVGGRKPRPIQPSSLASCVAILP